MACGEPAPKKYKTKDTCCIFRSFHSNSKLMATLRSACAFIGRDDGGYGGVCSKIVTSDADFPVSFSNAACWCKEVYLDANARKGYSLISIFDHGFTALEDFLENPDKLPESKGRKLALAKLLSFLKEKLPGRCMSSSPKWSSTSLFDNL